MAYVHFVLKIAAGVVKAMPNAHRQQSVCKSSEKGEYFKENYQLFLLKQLDNCGQRIRWINRGGFRIKINFFE